jgi:hypothetical protein
LPLFCSVPAWPAAAGPSTELPRSTGKIDVRSKRIFPGSSILAARRIQPRIAARLPLLAGREGERLLEAGGVAGKIVLLAGAV